MPYPLEFGVATTDGPSSYEVAMSRVCIRGGGPSCCGWGLMGVSPVRPGVVGSSPSLACQSFQCSAASSSCHHCGETSGSTPHF